MSDNTYAAIRAYRGRFPVRLMCEALGVSAGGFFAARLGGLPRGVRVPSMTSGYA